MMVLGITKDQQYPLLRFCEFIWLFLGEMRCVLLKCSRQAYSCFVVALYININEEIFSITENYFI